MIEPINSSHRLVLGVDIGTSGMKGVLCTPQGRVLAQTRIPIDVARPKKGWAEHSPDAWWAGFKAIVRDVTGGDRSIVERVAGVGISGICPVLVPVDRDGRALRPAILYSIDQRAEKEVGILRKQYPEDEPFMRSGQPLGSQNLLAKILWLRSNEEYVWQNSHSFLGSSGYLVQKLTGRATVDHFSAADGGLGYDLDRRDWDHSVLKDLEIPARLLPTLYWPADVAGRVQGLAAKESGLPPGAVVVAGTGDALADLIATGVEDSGQGALLYGTSMSTMVLADKRSTSREVVTVPGWQPDQLVQSAILSMGVGLFEWWARWCGEDWSDSTFNSIDAAIERSGPGAGGLLQIPYLAGARRSLTGGALFGLRADHSAADRVCATAEGLGHALRALLRGSALPNQLFAIGGGTASRKTVQTISDICGFDQIVLDTTTNAALGAARLAAQGSGVLETEVLSEWPDESSRVLAQPQYEHFYDQRQKIFDAMVCALSEIQGTDLQEVKENISV